MIIKKLSSSLESFNDISLTTGLNIIIGAKSERGSDTNRTVVNAVGKSLIGRLLNFCFLSDDKTLCEAFESSEYRDVHFTTTLDKNGISHNFTRTVRGTYLYNNEEKTNSQYQKKLQEFFNITEVGFRSVIKYFLRNQKEFGDYIISSKNSVNDIKAISYIIGLDISKCVDKKKLVTDKKLQKKLYDNLIPFLKDDNEVELRRLNYESEIERSKQKLQNYQVAEEYEHLVTSLKQNEFEHKDLINAITSAEYSLQQAKEYLSDISEDSINTQDIKSIYEQLHFVFPEKILANIEAGEQFHKQLYKNRKHRLQDNIEELNTRILNIKEQCHNITQNINSLTEQLSTAGTLEEYSVISNKLTVQEKELQELNFNKNKLEEINVKKQEIESELSAFIITLNQYYLDTVQEISNQYKVFFRNNFTLVNQGIEDGLITIAIDDNNDNQQAFKIDIRTSRDASESIKAAAIFVFDWLLLINGITTNDFLYHDNTVYHADSQICIKMLELAHEWCLIHNKQYICCIDQEKIDNILRDNPEFQEFLNTHIKATLTYDNNLLGFQIPISDKK